MLRIDPLTEKGTIDVDFFSSEEYIAHSKIVEKYLKDEGFETITEDFVIQIVDRLWSIRRISP